MGESKTRPTAKPKAVRKPAAPKVPAARAPRVAGEAVSPVETGMRVSPEERHRMIAEAAYFRAQQRTGPASPEQDWLEAEAEVDTLLLGRD